MPSIKEIFNRIFRKRVPQIPEAAQNQVEKRELNTTKDLREYMEETGAVEFFYDEMDKMFSERELYRTMGAHDVDHTTRVMYFANVLAKLDNFNERDRKLLLAAARYHDIGRTNDRVDMEHGKYARYKLETQNLLKDFSKEDRNIIMFAVEQHSLSREENANAVENLPAKKREQYSKILSYLKDADALDRVRIANKNMQLDPSRLRTETAKNLTNFAKDIFYSFDFSIKGEYAIRTFAKEKPVLGKIYNLIKDSINADWVINNQDYVIDLYNRGILHNLKKDDVVFLDFLETERLEEGARQVEKGDFEALRNKGYNITYESFLEIVSYYKEGTLDILRRENRLDDIFKKETFEKYGKPEDFDDKLKNVTISDKEMLDKINKNSSVRIMQQTFERDYMLYKNMYENHKNAFDLLEYTDLDISFKSIAGILEKIHINDLNKFQQKGFKFSIDNLVVLASRFSPEEYRDIVDFDRLQDLFKYDPEKDQYNEYPYLWERLKQTNGNISEEEFKNNYALYRDIIKFKYNIYELPEMRNYSIQEIYPAYMKVLSAEEKLVRDGKKVKFSARTIADVLEFSKKTKILDSADENEKESIIKLLIENGELKDDPRLIEYVTKKNKVYSIENVKDLYNYNKFCMQEILLDNDISLEDAKRNLINSIFTIEVPNKQEYTEEIEENIIDELYYYKKYKENGTLKLGMQKSKAEVEMDETISRLIKIMDSNTIQEFKENLQENYQELSLYNYDTIRDFTDSQLMEMSKKDITKQLNKTEEMLDNSMDYTVEYQGETIPVKILDGQDFEIAVTTVMPHCSSIARRTLNGDEIAIKSNMLNRLLNPNNRCTTFINQDMIAHAMSAIEEHELMYAYVPKEEDSISIVGKHDLSTVKRNNNGVVQRKTNRSVQNRTLKDIVGTTDEEHNEAVLNNVYPRYIVCFDNISEVAMQKYKMLKELYEKEGIDQEIEILFIEGKEHYLPRIDEKLNQNLDAINEEINQTGSISAETLDKFFNKRENNILIQTIQSINSYSYRNDLWLQNNAQDKLDYLISIFEKVGKVMPQEYIGDLMYQLDFLERKADKEDTRFGNRAYDHSYHSEIDIPKVIGIKNMLTDRLKGTKQEVEKEEAKEIDSEKNMSDTTIRE